VDAELETLSPPLRAKLTRIAELIVAVGLEHVHEPHVKQLEGKLWEMRVSARGEAARAVYVTASGRRVVIVHAFAKKTRKTPKAVLELARKRAKEVN
jgi:phage-related protein